MNGGNKWSKEEKIKNNFKKWGQPQRRMGLCKCHNIRIIGVPEEEDKKKDNEKILQEVIVENFPKMGKEIITQV